MKIAFLILFVSTSILAAEIEMPQPPVLLEIEQESSTQSPNVSEIKIEEDRVPWLPLSQSSVDRHLSWLEKSTNGSMCNKFRDEWILILKETVEKNKDFDFNYQNKLVEQFEENSTLICEKVK